MELSDKVLRVALLRRLGAANALRAIHSYFLKKQPLPHASRAVKAIKKVAKRVK